MVLIRNTFWIPSTKIMFAANCAAGKISQAGSVCQACSPGQYAAVVTTDAQLCTKRWGLVTDGGELPGPFKAYLLNPLIGLDRAQLEPHA